MAEWLKAKYLNSGERLRGMLREQIGELLLKLLFLRMPVEIRRVGVGVGSAEYTPATYTGIGDKFDYAIVYRGRRVYVEVTGSPLPKRESIKRFGRAYIGILPDKQRLALEAWSRGTPVYYLLVNEAEGELLFVRPQIVEKYAKPGYWAAGEKPYLLLPWRRNLMATPYDFHRTARLWLFGR